MLLNTKGNRQVTRSERPLGDGKGPLESFAADLRRLRDGAGCPTDRELASRTHCPAATLAEAAGGRELPTLAVTRAYVRACGGDADEWTARWHEVAAALPPGDDAPYPGLAAFRPEDVDRFFGRERLVRELRERLARHPVVLFGPSGAGKSSVLRAGLVAGESGAVALFTPGSRPWEECAIRLARLGLGTPDALRAELADDPCGLHRLVRRLDRPLLVVDQFEEIFTRCPDEGERAGFIAALVGAAEHSRVVLGVRDDCFARCAAYPELRDVLRHAQLIVEPMTADELREAVTRPAVLAGCTVEDALVARLVADAAGRTDVLPQVSHVLREAWRRRSGDTVTLDGYERAGGLDQAISNTAEDAYLALDLQQRTLARKVFLRLTVLGESTVDILRRVPRAEPDLAAVQAHLIRAGLLVADHDTVEIGHEALFRSWPRLHGWLAEEREAERRQRELAEAAGTWLERDRDPGSLLHGDRLAAVLDWATDARLDAPEQEFLRRSIEREARGPRRLRRLVAVLAVLLLLAVGATWYAMSAQHRHAGQRDVALSQKVAADANALRPTNPSLAAQLALAAYRLAPTVEARSALLGAFASPFTATVRMKVNAIAFTRDNRRMASGGDDRTLRLWDVTSSLRPTVAATLPYQPDDIESLEFSADGTLLVAAHCDGRVRLWGLADARNPVLLADFKVDDEPVYRAALSPDATVVATAGNDGRVRLWDISTRDRPVPLAVLTGHTDTVWTAVFSPDGSLLATASEDGTARLWRVADRRAPSAFATIDAHRQSVRSVAFSPEGRRLATGGTDHTARLWDVTGPSPAPLGVLSGHTGPVQVVAFSPDNRTVATTGSDCATKLWDTAAPDSPVLLGTLTGHTQTVYTLVFAPDGHVLVSAGDDGTALFTEVPGPVLGVPPSWSASPSPDGGLLAVGSEDNAVRLWDVRDPRRPVPRAVLTDATAPVKSVVFSPDGRFAAAGASDGTVGYYDLTYPDHPRRVARFAHQGSVRTVAFGRQGRLLATAGYDHVVRLWDLTDHRPLGVLRGDGNEGIFSAAISPDGNLVAGVMNRRIRLWDVTDPRSPRALADLEGHTARATSAVFSPDGRTVATGSLDRTARLWDVTDPATPRPKAVLSGHSGVVQSVAFSPDGGVLATAGFDRTTRLWDVTGPPRPLAVLADHTDRVYSVAFAGHTLVTASEDHTVRLWDVDVESVAARVCGASRPRITEQEWREHFPDLPYTPPCPT